MFIELLFTNPRHYFFVIIAVLFSVILHELAHGWAAIWQGDTTPIDRGHMTPDPRKHMPPVSLVLLAFTGLCWGEMPVNPYRFRSKYGHAIVSAAGPAMNVLIAIVSLIVLAATNRLPIGNADFLDNLHDFLFLCAYMNLALAFFNMLPAPPLDGSKVLANFNPKFSYWLNENPQMHMPLFIAAFFLMSMLGIVKACAELVTRIIILIA